MVVKLNSGVDYRGVLACLDGYMNIALEQSEECGDLDIILLISDPFIHLSRILMFRPHAAAHTSHDVHAVVSMFTGC